MKISLPPAEISDAEIRSIVEEYVDRAFHGEGVTDRHMILQTYIRACEKLKNDLECELSMLQQEEDVA